MVAGAHSVDTRDVARSPLDLLGQLPSPSTGPALIISQVVRYAALEWRPTRARL